VLTPFEIVSAETTPAIAINEVHRAASRLPKRNRSWSLASSFNRHRHRHGHHAHHHHRPHRRRRREDLCRPRKLPAPSYLLGLPEAQRNQAAVKPGLPRSRSAGRACAQPKAAPLAHLVLTIGIGHELRLGLRPYKNRG